MDEVDWQIIDILLRDARTPFSEIGKRLSLGKDSIQKRVKKLHSEGILGTPIAIIDAKKCGFQGIIDFFIKLEITDRQAIDAELTKLPYISSIAETIGDYNLYVSSFFRNIDDINQIIASFKRLKGIQWYEMFYYSLDVSNPLLMPFVSGNPENSILYKIEPYAQVDKQK